MILEGKNRKLYQEIPFSPKEYTGTQRDVLIENSLNMTALIVWFRT